LRHSILIVLLALAAFGATAGGSFHFDDYSLFRSPAVVDADGWRHLFRLDQTRPLTYFTFWLNYQAGGRNPAVYHLLNLALHVASALLLFRIARRIVSSRAALIAAALFAVHPILTQSVAYVFARGTLLMTVLCLLSLDAWLRGRIWLATAIFAAALLAKEECVAFPVFLLLFHFSASRARREFPAIAAMLALALAAGLRILYAISVTRAAGSGSQAGVTPLDYLAAQGPVIARYLRQIAIPWGFSIDPLIGPSPAWLVIVCWAAVLASAAFAAKWFRNARAGFWFLGGLVLLLPSSSVLPAADLAADRRMYMPMVALAVAAGLLLERIDWRATAAIVAVVCAISIRYSIVWLTEQSLWTEAVALAPVKVRPRIQLSRVVEPQRALEILKEAETIAPSDPAIASEEGRIYLSAGLAPQALSAFGRALALAPANAEAMQNRGVALLALGQSEAARQDFERALKANPCLFEARINLRRMGAALAQAPSSCRFTSEQLSKLAGAQ
jgi:tetratricopeptide (TPR) repeat protein